MIISPLNDYRELVLVLGTLSWTEMPLLRLGFAEGWRNLSLEDSGTLRMFLLRFIGSSPTSPHGIRPSPNYFSSFLIPLLTLLLDPLGPKNIFQNQEPDRLPEHSCRGGLDYHS